MGNAGQIFRLGLSLFFEYNTPRIVHIRSKKVGIINRLLQLTIIAYVIGYAIVYKKGYQEFDDVQSAVTTKVKGIVFSNYSHLPDIGMRTWDVADYVIPPQENSAFFVMTNVVPTLNQTQSYCSEDPTIQDVQCKTDSDCERIKGYIMPGGNGPITGKCVNSTGHNKTCEIFGWCPVENPALYKNLTEPILAGSQNFTVFIKNNIEFPKFKVMRRNVLDFYTSDADLGNCRWNRSDSKGKYCPIFVLDDIANDAGVKYDDLTIQGGVMQVIIDWTCDLDYSIDKCLPQYTFRRLDRGDYSIAKGFNFRYADKYAFKENDTIIQYRNLYKATGIIFVVTVQGKAGKFSVVPLILNLGSGMALLVVSTIICDFIVLYVLKARKFYREKKYLDVQGQDAFQMPLLSGGHTTDHGTFNHILDEERDQEGNFNNSVKRRVQQASE
ncbi:P2X purinoceptor 4-like isoform X2 [Physella acuta]|uniref:P2X purinoceptor 4-like isoform X2 n=1 Tax=Physella acuta TaxID=109671 RepID=UPI0027DD7008|nr:P2X purinoceptor 4-like isoform X2 [Physella acuta]